MELAEELATYNSTINSIINVLGSDVADLINAKVADTPKYVRAQKLKAYLCAIEAKYTIPTDTLILIELQPPFNGSCDTIGDQICFHFCDRYKVEFISAKLKNKVVIGEKTIHDFKATNKKMHTAEKKYADYNRHICEKVFNLEFTISKRALENHISDAFMQVLAYILHVGVRTDRVVA